MKIPRNGFVHCKSNVQLLTEQKTIPKKATLTAQMEKLNNVQIRAFRQIFENFDLEKSGTLTAEELHKCINQLAGYQALSFQDVVHILEDLDVKERIQSVHYNYVHFECR